MRYATRDGMRLEGDTAADIIDGLRADTHAPGRDRAHFLEILAEGARMQTGGGFRSTDCETLLADLVTAGLMERLD